MRYRICKTFTVESGHMLSKHPERCRFLHGHTRQIEVVLSSEQLDANDMVCDFKTIKLAISDYIDQYDHAMAVNTADPMYPLLKERGQRLVEFKDEDPTTEVLARSIFEHVASVIERGDVYSADSSESGCPSSNSAPADSDGVEDASENRGYRFPAGLRLDRIRVWETPSSWAEYGRD
ncbi:MAG: 6-pyruvoyl trahydropterin synthase family protein [Planctomycetota bacterium]